MRIRWRLPLAFAMATLVFAGIVALVAALSLRGIVSAGPGDELLLVTNLAHGDTASSMMNACAHAKSQAEFFRTQSMRWHRACYTLLP